jgi:hypothetical protein
MVLHRHFLLLSTVMLLSCASLPQRDDTLEIPGSDDAAAASALEGFLRDLGMPVEAGSDDQSVFVYRRGMATLLTPITRSGGLDRLMATRSYAPAAGRSEEDLLRLSSALNDQLNVGSFSVQSGALIFQTHMTFLDEISAAQITAFLDWLDTAELAIIAVDGDGSALSLSEV